MPKIVKLYTLEELCNENKKIIIKTQDGVEIGIEASKEGTTFYLYFGNDIIKRTFDYLIPPKDNPMTIIVKNNE